MPPYNNAILVITEAYTSGSDSVIAPKNIAMRFICDAVGTAPSAFADKIICSGSRVLPSRLSRFPEVQGVYALLMFGFMELFFHFLLCLCLRRYGPRGLLDRWLGGTRSQSGCCGIEEASCSSYSNTNEMH